MTTQHFDHIAFASNNTDKSMSIFSLLGFKRALFYKQKIDKFGALITKLQSENGQIVELVEPCSPQNVVSNLLVGKEATLYHAAFFTPDLHQTLQQLKSVGAVVITEPQEIPYPSSVNHQHYKTAHISHPYVGLFEITGPILNKV